MNCYRADLHIHTVLSPCADIEMTPGNIVKRALETGLQMIGITDHNSTKNALLTKKLGEREGLIVLTGAEVTTKEEVHCLVFFESEDQLTRFQKYIDENITVIPNPDGHFGYQSVVDEHDNITELVSYYLHAALKISIGQLRQYVKSFNGLFIPAHVDRPMNGLFSQLGFLPPGLNPDAMGISKFSAKKDVAKHHNIPSEITLIRNSDAHYLDQIGEIYTGFWMEEMSYNEIRMALQGQQNRRVEIA
jgi:3',5'-nucleoside bisphosphate phosphatase